MGSKPLWPAIPTPMPENTREYGHMLGLYTDSTLKLIQDGHQPPAKNFKSFPQASSALIKNNKQEPKNHLLPEGGGHMRKIEKVLILLRRVAKHTLRS